MLFLLFLLSLSSLPVPSLSDTSASASSDENVDLDAPTCSIPGAVSDAEPDPALHEIDFDIGYGPETFEAYVQPDVSTFYGEEAGARGMPKKPRFNGLAGKFVNMSPQSVKLFWDPKNGRPGSIIAACRPFTACGTATFPTHRFYFSPHNQPDERLITFEVENGRSVYFYDPYDAPGDSEQTKKNLEALTFEEFQKYEQHARNRQFMEVYKKETGRDYLAMYARDKPSHFMWRADLFGERHWVTTKETHFVELPPEDELGKVNSRGKERILAEDEPRILQQYRDPDQGAQLNMTLKVLSCAPRAFEIQNFLSGVEVDHIVKIATGADLRLSTTGDGTKTTADSGTKTRTSRNSWVSREESPIVDAVYRRAADLLRIDEALLRYRGAGERPELDTPNSVAETLQLVHYDVGQEYTAHHDFGYGSQDHALQPERFATVLLYLNQGMKGGETSFPRWVNSETSEPLKVTPEVGKAVLFYSQLPDGNMDDLSQHAAVPVTEGEKWLINLWVRDPVYG